MRIVADVEAETLRLVAELRELVDARGLARAMRLLELGRPIHEALAAALYPEDDLGRALASLLPGRDHDATDVAEGVVRDSR